ncbi:MAG: zinc ribbon domain-containing protein [Anaerolineae bacterium]|nr:zinc ribbon domain-containing protein [Anaerolineae bacterium]
MTPDPTTLSNIILVLTAWGSAFFIALWIGLIIWTYRDIRLRKSDPLFRILAVLIVTVLFVPGVVVYLVIRPKYTIEEEYQKSLEEEALLLSIEETHLCPGCNSRTHEDWTVCPNCHTKLKKSCRHCGKTMQLSWNICPHCGTPAPSIPKETPEPASGLTDFENDQNDL